MIKDLDTVALTRDLPEHGLMRGELGAVVLTYDDGGACEIEFVAADGTTRALLMLDAADFRLATDREIMAHTGRSVAAE